MKKILNIGLLLVAVLSITSCKKVLDVEPQQSIDAGTALQTPACLQTQSLMSLAFVFVG